MKKTIALAVVLLAASPLLADELSDKTLIAQLAAENMQLRARIAQLEARLGVTAPAPVAPSGHYETRTVCSGNTCSQMQVWVADAQPQAVAVGSYWYGWDGRSPLLQGSQAYSAVGACGSYGADPNAPAFGASAPSGGRTPWYPGKILSGNFGK